MNEPLHSSKMTYMLLWVHYLTNIEMFIFAYLKASSGCWQRGEMGFVLCLDCPVKLLTSDYYSRLLSECCFIGINGVSWSYTYRLEFRRMFNHGENLAISKLAAMKTMYSSTRQNPQNRGTRNLHQIITSREPIRLKSRNTNAITIPIWNWSW